MMNQPKKVVLIVAILLCMPALSHSLSTDELWTPFPTYKSANYTYRAIAVGSLVVGTMMAAKEALPPVDHQPSVDKRPFANAAIAMIFGPIAGFTLGKLITKDNRSLWLDRHMV